MTHQAQNLVNCFLSSDFSTYTGAGLSGFSGNENYIYFNDMILLKYNNGNVLLFGGVCESATIQLINLLPGFNAILKNGQIFINGFEWDGKKANLSLFID